MTARTCPAVVTSVLVWSSLANARLPPTQGAKPQWVSLTIRDTLGCGGVKSLPEIVVTSLDLERPRSRSKFMCCPAAEISDALFTAVRLSISAGRVCLESFTTEPTAGRSSHLRIQ